MSKFTDYDNVIVPIDGSPNSKLAFKRALVIAGHHPAKLHLVHVIDDLTDLTGASGDYIDTISHADKKQLKRFQQIAKQHDVQADCKIAYGSPKVVISDNLVNYYHANLIVMGANGLTKVERVLLGSVAAHVSRTAKCDVLLVKERH